MSILRLSLPSIYAGRNETPMERSENRWCGDPEKTVSLANSLCSLGSVQLRKWDFSSEAVAGRLHPNDVRRTQARPSA
jgi:hypothetical protein